MRRPLFRGAEPMRTVLIRVAASAGMACLLGWLLGCRPSQPPSSEAPLPFLPEVKPSEQRVIEIPPARRKQVFRETEKLIDRFQAKLRALNEDVAEGRISPQGRIDAMAKLREQFDAELEAVMERYGLRTTHYPAIRAEGLEQGW